MPLFRKESRSKSSSSTNGLASAPGSTPNFHSTNTKANQQLDPSIPLPNANLNGNGGSTNNTAATQLHTVNSSTSLSSVISNTSDTNDHDNHRRVTRSSSVSQKFKNLFVGGNHQSNDTEPHRSESIKRVNSASSLLKKRTNHSDLPPLDTSSNQLPNSKITTPIHHPSPLPIPDRSSGRLMNNSKHAIQTNDLSQISHPITKIKAQQQLQSHNAQPHEDQPSSSNSSLTLNMDHSKTSRIRSSTVSGNFFHPKPSNTNLSKLYENKDDNATLNDNSSIHSNSSTLYPSTNNNYSHYHPGNEKDPRKLQGLYHTETVNYGSTHLRNERDKSIKLCSGRVQVYEFGRSHEHDYTKYKTHTSTKPLAGIFSWMKKKESRTEKDEPYDIIEKSVSLLPDKYSGDLMRVKNDPKNYIWNYDDDDDDDEDEEDDDEDDSLNETEESEYTTESDDDNNAVPASSSNKSQNRRSINRKMSTTSIHSSRSTKSRQSVRLTKHYNSDDEYENVDDYAKEIANHHNKANKVESPTLNRKSSSYISSSEEENDDYDDDEDDDDDDDFDDEIDDMLIEPIIGKEQVFLINSMLNKIEHPEKFKARIREKEKDGKIKLTLSQKYGHIQGVVGKGSYGTVCISSKVVNNTRIYFAIKQIKRKQGENLHHFGNRVTSEFMISSSLTHQAVINVYDLMVDPVSMTYSEIMEFIPCGDLFSLISLTNGLDIVECDCFFKQILNAITYLHSVGVSHNDLKVENLLLTRKGQLKITDFGTSAVFRTAWESDVQLSRGACGSERYVAPEQYQKDRDYDPRLGDVWSLGVIYLTMYYGKYSWEAAKLNDETFEKFLETRAVFDYSKKSTTKAHQFSCIRKGAYPPIEGISGGILNSWINKGGSLDSNVRENEEEMVNNSRRYVLYNILNPNPTFRMRTYQIWQSDWIKNFRVCDAGRGYVSYDNYIEMALKSAQDAENREKEREKERERENEVEKEKATDKDREVHSKNKSDQADRSRDRDRDREKDIDQNRERDRDRSVSVSTKSDRKETKKAHGFLGFGGAKQ